MATKKKVAGSKKRGVLTKTKITKKQMQFTNSQMTEAVRKASALFKAKHIPVIITAVHPDGFVSSTAQGLPEYLPMLAVQSEMACKEAAVSIVKADKSVIKSLSEACDIADGWARTERARLRKELADAMGFKEEAPNEVGSIEELMELLKAASNDPQAKISVLKIPAGNKSAEKAN